MILLRPNYEISEVEHTTNNGLLFSNFPIFFHQQARTPRTCNSPDGAVVTRDTSNVEISGSIPLLGNFFFLF